MSSAHDIRLEHETLVTLRSRVLVAGDAAVGKTAVVKMLASGGSDYPRNYVMTTAIELATRAIKVPAAEAALVAGSSSSATGAGASASASSVGAAAGGGIRTCFQVEFALVDTPGSTIFNQREAGMKIWGLVNYIALVFDVGSKASFASVTKWARRAQDARAASDVPSLAGKPIAGVLLGAKCDFRDEDGSGQSRAEVSFADAAALAASLGLSYFEVSAEAGKGVEKPFEHLARLVLKGYETEVAHATELAQ